MSLLKHCLARLCGMPLLSYDATAVQGRRKAQPLPRPSLPAMRTGALQPAAKRRKAGAAKLPLPPPKPPVVVQAGAQQAWVLQLHHFARAPQVTAIAALNEPSWAARTVWCCMGLQRAWCIHQISDSGASAGERTSLPRSPASKLLAKQRVLSSMHRAWSLYWPGEAAAQSCRPAARLLCLLCLRHSWDNAFHAEVNH